MATLSLMTMLGIATVIGYLAQTTGICMVRGVRDWMRGRWLRLLAIFSSGFWMYMYIPLGGPLGGAAAVEPARLPVALDWSIALGGLLFGLGAAANGACSVSTASRLASGDLRMLPTVMGWLLGWLLLDLVGMRPSGRTLTPVGDWVTWPVLGALLAAALLVYRRKRHYWRMWYGITLVGILTGGLFLLEPFWSPSDFVHDLGLAIVRGNAAALPVSNRVGLLTCMLLGMGIGAWWYGRFRWILPGPGGVARHLASGTLMGIGAALALGGNDFQLLMAVPALSPAGFGTLIAMLIGIRLGIGMVRWRSGRHQRAA